MSSTLQRMVAVTERAERRKRDELIPNVTVPVGTRGKWAVERFTINKDEAILFNMQQLFSGHGGRAIHPGTFTKLMRSGEIIMSDTPAEKRDHISPVLEAHGHCLINGLGLGMVANAMLRQRDVTKVTVVELDADVIELIAPHYRKLYGDRFEVIHANAYDYIPPKGLRYGAVWHDIWDAICADNLPEMSRLHRKYGRRTDWQGSWTKWECQRQARADLR